MRNIYMGAAVSNWILEILAFSPGSCLANMYLRNRKMRSPPSRRSPSVTSGEVEGGDASALISDFGYMYVYQSPRDLAVWVE